MIILKISKLQKAACPIYKYRQTSGQAEVAKITTYAIDSQKMYYIGGKFVAGLLCKFTNVDVEESLVLP